MPLIIFIKTSPHMYLSIINECFSPSMFLQIQTHPHIKFPSSMKVGAHVSSWLDKSTSLAMYVYFPMLPLSLTRISLSLLSCCVAPTKSHRVAPAAFSRLAFSPPRPGFCERTRTETQARLIEWKVSFCCTISFFSSNSFPFSPAKTLMRLCVRGS